MLGLGNSITSAGITETVFDLTSLRLHVDSLNVVSATVGSEVLVSALVPIVGAVQPSQATNANKPTHDTTNNKITFAFESTGSDVPFLEMATAVTLTDAFTIVFAFAAHTDGSQTDAVSNIVGSNVDANNHSHLSLTGDSGDALEFELRADSSASGSNLSDTATADMGEGNPISAPATIYALTKSAGASATVTMFSFFADEFAEEGSSTAFDEDIDFVVKQIGGVMDGTSAGSNEQQGNMHFYELLVYDELLTEAQIQECFALVKAKHADLND
jgi:hypothetical protein